MPSNKIKKHEPKIRLVNKFTLALLLFSSLSVLWLVTPSSSKLVQLIGQSSSPEVSLAFLNQISEHNPNNQEVEKQIADNHIQLGQLDDANRVLESMISREGESNNETLETHLSLLLAQVYQSNPSTQQDATKKLLTLLDDVDHIADPNLARKYADAAIAFSLPSKGLKYLTPHAQNNITDYQELVSLALQSEDYPTALAWQKTAFDHTEDLTQAQALFNLYLSLDQPEKSHSFLSQYQGTLSNDADFLTASIQHSEKIGNLDIALAQAEKLLAIKPIAELYRQVADLAMSNGNLELATLRLQQLIVLDGQKQDYQSLHTLYRWQGDIRNAQAISIKLLALSPTEKQIRNGIEDSKALSDLYYESEFYDALAINNLIRPQEYVGWLDALEKAQGTDSASKSVATLAYLRPNDSLLKAHKMRLYSYQRDPVSTTSEWYKLLRLRTPTYDEALIASNAFLDNHQPELALRALTLPKVWTKANNDYLTRVSRLAWETNNRDIATQSFEELATRRDHQLDIYRYFQVLSPLDKKQHQRLLALYNETGNDQILLMLIRANQQEKEMKTLTQLLELAKKKPHLVDTLEITHARVFRALHLGDTKKAKYLLERLLERVPSEPLAVNQLIWLAIEKNNRKQMKKLYETHKLPLADNPDVWLAFASVNQQLGNLEHALLWYKQLLTHTTDVSPSILLNYATVLEENGQLDSAYQLRHYVLTQKRAALLSMKDGDINHRALIGLFTDPRFALSMIEAKATHTPSPERTAELFSHYLANNQTDRLLFWHQRTTLSQYPLPDWQRLALAMQRDDLATIEKLLEQSVNLATGDQYVALQKLGRHQKAWKKGERKLGTTSNKAKEAQLRRIHALQNPDKNHSLRGQAVSISHWGINRYSLDYYAPHQYGFWRLGTDYQRADAPDVLGLTVIDAEHRIRARYRHQLLKSYFELGLDIAQGVGDQRLGLNGNYHLIIGDALQLKVNAGVNSHIETSDLLTIAGQDNTIGIQAIYQPTLRESISLRVNFHDLETRFGDAIGQGWDMNFRLTEHLYFNDPAWQAYLDVSMHEIAQNHGPLKGINQWAKSGNTITSQDFITQQYQRVAIGQRISRGVPGQPGSSVPTIRYWLDTSLGYNLLNSQPDLSIDAGLGIPILGSDELYLSTRWQTQDRNGNEALQLSFGYYYSF